MTNNVFHVCDSCADALVDYDFSRIDGFAEADMQDTDTDYYRVQLFAEAVGDLVEAGRATKAGYWQCESCEQICVGSAYALETV